MAYIRRHTVNIAVTAVDGTTQSFQTTWIPHGFIEAIRYTRATASAVATNANLLITAGQSALTILNVTATGDFTRYPRAQANGVTGDALGFSSNAAPPIVPVHIPVAGERINIQVSSGGAASAATDALRATVDLYIRGG